MHHSEEVLHEIVRSLECVTGLAESDKILLFNLIKRLRVTDKQPDSRVWRIFLDAFDVDGGLNLCLFECSKVAIHAPI